MFRNDILWVIPAVLLAFFQIKFIWSKLPQPKEEETEIKGDYTHLDKVRLDYLIRWLCLIFWIQLVIPILTITSNSQLDLILKLIGYLFIVSGFWTAYMALKTLGSNWAGMVDYQIKKNQKLITTGIYNLTRNPIYFGAVLEVVGFELLVNSWLVIVFMVVIYQVLTAHIRKEEELLKKKFGQDYIKYQKTTKMLIPYIF